jgi:hypothetical protein
MIGLIENAKFLTQASWRSPITSGQPGAGEHFDLLAVVKRIPPEDQKASFAPPGAAIPSLAPAVPAAAPPVAAAEPNAAAPAPPQTAIRPPPAGPPGFREPEVVDAGALLGRPKK